MCDRVWNGKEEMDVEQNVYNFETNLMEWEEEERKQWKGRNKR